MRRFYIPLILAGLFLALSAGATWATNAHFIGTPTCSLSNNGTTVTCTGKVAGLGQEPTVVQLTIPFDCANRGSKQHEPAGLASSQTPPITPRNGQITFKVSASGKCPDGMTPTFGPDATITVFQNGSPVLGPTSVPVS